MGLSLYFTGAQAYGCEQTQPINSIGGYVSGSQVPSGQVNAIFDGISNKGENSSLCEYICLALKNDGVDNLSDVTVYTVSPYEDVRVKLSVAAVDPDVSLIQNQKIQYRFANTENRRVKPAFIQDFYNVKSSFPSARLELVTSASLGETITLLGVDTLEAESNLTIDQTYQLIVDAFENNATYSVTLIEKSTKTLNTDNTSIYYGDDIVTDEKYLLVEKLTVGQDTSPVTFSSDGTATLKQSYTFSGGKDNAVSIGPIDAGSYVGLWFKKEVVKVSNSTDTSRLFPEQLPKTEDVKLFFDYTVEIVVP